MKQYNSRTADKFVLRLPEGMRDRLISAAKDSKRSMNSEIIFRLENSLTPAQVPQHYSGRWCPGVGELCVHGDFGIGKIEDFEVQDGCSVYATVLFSDGRARIQLHPKTTLRPFTV